MTEAGWKLPWTGGCRCDRLRFQVGAPPVFASACHCRGCQRMTGGAYSMTLTLPSEGFAVTAGDPVVGGLHGDQSQHMHCAYCLSWAFTRVGGGAMVNLRASLLDDPYWFRPFADVCAAEKLSFAETGAPLRFDRFPDPADYPALSADYAARGARPG